MAIKPFSDRIKELQKDVIFEIKYIEILNARGGEADIAIVNNLKPALAVKRAELEILLTFQ